MTRLARRLRGRSSRPRRPSTWSSTSSPPSARTVPSPSPGGDPAEPDHLELIEHNAGNGLYTFVNTSGYGLDSAKVRKLNRAAGGRLSMGFSLDSVDDGVQERCRAGGRPTSRGFCGSVTRTTCPTSSWSRSPASTWERSENVRLAERAEDPRDPVALRPPRCRGERPSSLLRPGRRGEAHLTGAARAPAELRQLHALLRRPGRHPPDPGRSGALPGEPGLPGRPHLHRHQRPGRRGALRPPPRQPGPLRQRAEQPLSRIFEESEVLRTLRGERPVKGKCSRCRYGDSCRGCRSLAYYHTGDYLAEDPSCFFEPETTATRSPYEELQTRNTRVFLSHLVRHRPWSELFGSGGRLGVALLDLKARIMDLAGRRVA